MQLVSGVYFAYAVMNIRNHLSLNGGTPAVNLSMLIVNTAAFALYIASIVVLYFFYTIYYTTDS
jgi:hypothetical protein